MIRKTAALLGSLERRFWISLFLAAVVLLGASLRLSGARLARDLILRFGRPGKGVVSVRRGPRGCRADVNFQLEAGYAPTVSIDASSGLCDALEGKSPREIPIHFVPSRPLEDFVALDTPLQAPSPLESKRLALLAGSAWLRSSMRIIALPCLVFGVISSSRWGERRSATWRRIVLFLTKPRSV